MQKEVQVAAFEGGSLRVLAFGDAGREAVLALPLSRLLVKLVRVPAEQDPVAVAQPILQTINPFPDEPLTVSCELVQAADDGSRLVLAAALPESAADDIGEALDAQKLSVTRVDALALGQLRGIWGQLGESSARRVVIMRELDGLSLVVLDGGLPMAIRALTDASDLRRELMMCLLEAEDFGGAKPLAEIVVVTADSVEGLVEVPGEELAGLANVRELTVGADAALVGVAERSQDPDAFNALPASWAEMLAETRFKARLTRYLAIAGGIWLLIIAVLFGVPAGYDFMTSRQKSMSKQHSRQYRAVKEMQDKVKVVQKYSDHSRGALEIMRAVSESLPEDITLNNWNFKREEGVRISGEADTANSVYELKNRMDALAYEGEGEDSERVFQVVNLIGPSAGRGGKQKFDLELTYEAKEEQ